jgi:hypothetical protein
VQNKTKALKALRTEWNDKLTLVKESFADELADIRTRSSTNAGKRTKRIKADRDADLTKLKAGKARAKANLAKKKSTMTKAAYAKAEAALTKRWDKKLADAKQQWTTKLEANKTRAKRALDKAIAAKQTEIADTTARLNAQRASAVEKMSKSADAKANDAKIKAITKSSEAQNKKLRDQLDAARAREDALNKSKVGHDEADARKLALEGQKAARKAARSLEQLMDGRIPAHMKGAADDLTLSVKELLRDPTYMSGRGLAAEAGRLLKEAYPDLPTGGSWLERNRTVPDEELLSNMQRELSDADFDAVLEAEMGRLNDPEVDKELAGLDKALEDIKACGSPTKGDV